MPQMLLYYEPKISAVSLGLGEWNRMNPSAVLPLAHTVL